jgi:hypothetical protein
LRRWILRRRLLLRWTCLFCRPHHTVIRIVSQVFLTINGSAGGSLQLSSSSPDGIDIPAGAFAGNESIGILELEESSLPLTSSLRVIGSAKDFKPDGLRFSKPVRIKLSFPDSFASRLLSSTYAIQFYNVSTKAWERVPGGGVNSASKFVFAETDHFSLYAIMEDLPFGLNVVGLGVGVGVGGFVLIASISAWVYISKKKKQRLRQVVKSTAVAETAGQDLEHGSNFHQPNPDISLPQYAPQPLPHLVGVNPYGLPNATVVIPLQPEKSQPEKPETPRSVAFSPSQAEARSLECTEHEVVM